MNLIERLGGYGAAKEALHRLKSEKKDLISCGASVFVESQIVDALIKYRRQHNIYEVGDNIVSTAGFIRTVFKITDITDEFIRADHLELRHGAWRHATDAEIEAGKRLEVD